MANINDVINGLKTKYNITDSTTEQELLELLNVVTVDEINAIKATSVIPLPNVVKGSPQELKERFVKIVSDEQRGIANVINTRMGLLRIFLAAYMALETQRLGDKVNFTDIIDSLVSEATDKALSAKQGKVLKDLIDTLTVGNDRLVDGSVSESKLASNSVSEAKIKAGSITTDKLADDSVSNDKVKVNAIHTRNIKNGDITFDKLAQEVINYIDGIASGNSVYRGNYESVEDLPTGSLIHNNDYAYVTVEVEVEDEETHEVTLEPELARYKYRDGAWAFEYIIPNTSFSADEWEAIKSGITSTLVNKLKGIETGAQVNTQSDWNESDNTKDEYIKNKPNVVTTDTAQEISQDKTFNGAKIKFKNSAIDIWDIRKNGSTLEINRDNTVMMQLLTNIIKLKSLIPLSDDESLGNSGAKWKDIWFSGSLKDGTNELSLAQLKDAYDKALSALQSHQDISGKLDKTSTANSLYANGVNGQIMVGFGMGANGGKIPQRDSDGQINVPTTPTNNEHATAKVYVDNLNKDLKEKALYFKGAYDSADGKTRQTGYLTLDGSETWSAWGSSYPHLFYCYKTGIPANEKDITSNQYKSFEDIGSNYDNNSIYVLEDGRICINDINYSNVSSFKEHLKVNPVYVQYKGTSSYTDDGIIENQSILPLDTNMANKIRQRVVDGLNLFDKSKYTTLGGARCYIVDIKGNGTYTISANQSIYDFAIANFENGDFTNVFTNTTKNVSSFSFTITNYNPSLVYYALIRITLNGGYTTDLTPYGIMLVEGNHAYPYSDFNQREHITNAQAELLKSEEEKSSQLLNPYMAYVQNVVFGDTPPYTMFNYSGVRTVYIPLKAGTYTLSDYSSYNFALGWGTSVPANALAFNHIDAVVAGGSRTFTLTTDGYLYLACDDSQYTILGTTIMLVEGSQAQPYHEYCGEILHEVDVKPALLWGNGNPSGPFNYYGSSNPVAISNDYNYLIFAYKNDSGDKTIFYSKQSGKWGNTTMYYPLTLAKPNNYTYYRNFVRTSSTSGYFENGKNGISGQDDNTVMLPVAIYGSKY